MQITRRQLVQTMGAGGGSLVLGRKASAQVGYNPPPSTYTPNSPKLRKYHMELKHTFFYNLRFAAASGVSGYTHHVVAAQYKQWIHDGTPPLGVPANLGWGPTTLWGYHNFNDVPPSAATVYDPAVAAGHYAGPTIVAIKNVPVRLRVTNHLPPTHIVPVDDTVAGSYSGSVAIHNRIAVHCHGGHVQAKDDGHPLSWFDPNGNRGIEFQFSGLDLVGNDPIYTYPNDQTARLMWYHDHAVALTRLNAYAGLAAGYLLTDAIETALGTVGLPFPGIPLVLQEKAFNADGSLWYPSRQNPADLDGVHTPDPNAVSLVPEFFGDVEMVNGLAWPKLKVNKTPGKSVYRLRFLNGSQARFYRLKLFVAKPDAFGNLIPDYNQPGPGMYQVGTEGGFLPAMVNLNERLNRFARKLMLAPAERADVLIDFSDLGSSGTQWLILTTDAPGPFPSGDAPTADTSVVMAFELVTSDPNVPDGAASGVINGVRSAMNNPSYINIPPLNITGITPKRLTLNEAFDGFGRLIQMLGTDDPTPNNTGATLYGNGFGSVFLNEGTGVVLNSDNVRNNSTVVWDIINTTADTHPMHLHLVNFQVLNRWAYNVRTFMTQTEAFGGNPSGLRGKLVLGAPQAIDPNERGWKETARMNPGQVTRIAFQLAENPTWENGNYVWHCHILEHEEHDMMHQMKLLPSAPG